MNYNNIEFGIDNEIGTLTLNRPHKLNAFNAEVLMELEALINKVSKTKELRAIIITGAGRAFCTGGDLLWEKEIGEMQSKDTKKVILNLKKLFLKIEQLPQPTIAAINGYAVGGGVELAMACDIRIATKSTIFSHPETHLGVVAPLGGTQRLPRLIGIGKAKLMLYTGMEIDATTAYEWGLVDLIAEDTALMTKAMEIAQQITTKPQKPIELTKKAINKNYHKDLIDKDELNYYVACSKTPENRRRLNSFIESRRK
jgi:enoyl-CoA hydratase